MAIRQDTSVISILKDHIKIIPNSIKDKHKVKPDVLSRVYSIDHEDTYIKLVLKEGKTLCTFPSRKQ